MTEKTSFSRNVLDWLKSLLIALLIVTFIQYFGFNLSMVKGRSMQPTLHEGQWLFVNKFVFHFYEPGRGDVIILKDPTELNGNKQFLIKRVVGLPGEEIEIRDHHIYINGKMHEEPYTDVWIEGEYAEKVVVPKGHYYVMGDNRYYRQSVDSRLFSSVPKKLIVGRAELILWPFDEWNKIH